VERLNDIRNACGRIGWVKPKRGGVACRGDRTAGEIERTGSPDRGPDRGSELAGVRIEGLDDLLNLAAMIA